MCCNFKKQCVRERHHARAQVEGRGKTSLWGQEQEKSKGRERQRDRQRSRKTEREPSACAQGAAAEDGSCRDLESSPVQLLNTNSVDIYEMRKQKQG